MSPRRRNGGGHGHQPEASPRVRGAWKTPAVVVRAPDGSVVGRRPSPAPSTRRQRVRIPPPGVTGGALAAPSRAAAGAGGRRSPSRPVPGKRLDRPAPIDEEARERRNARLRWLGTRVGAVALSGVLVYAVFPVRTFLGQRSDNDRAREQLEVLSEENKRLEQRADELRDPETVEEIARRDHNLVMPGEESYGIMPAPEQAPEGDSPSEPGG